MRAQEVIFILDNGIVFALSFHYPQWRQNYAIDFIVHNSKSNYISDDEIGDLLNRGCKDTYSNTIKIFELLGYPKFAKAIPSMFELFQDLNWPGSMEAMRLLGSLDPGNYVESLNFSIKKAIELNDEEWVHGIGVFVDTYNVASFIDRELYPVYDEIITKYKNY